MLLPPFPLCRADLRGVFGGSHFYYTMPSPAFEPKLPFSGKIFLAPASRLGLSFSFPPLHDGPCKIFLRSIFLLSNDFPANRASGRVRNRGRSGVLPRSIFLLPLKDGPHDELSFSIEQARSVVLFPVSAVSPHSHIGAKEKRPVRPLFFYFNIFFVQPAQQKPRRDKRPQAVPGAGKFPSKPPFAPQDGKGFRLCGSGERGGVFGGLSGVSA